MLIEYLRVEERAQKSPHIPGLLTATGHAGADRATLPGRRADRPPRTSPSTAVEHAASTGLRARPMVHRASGDQDAVTPKVRRLRIFIRNRWTGERPDLPPRACSLQRRLK